MNAQDQPLKNVRVVPRVAAGDGYAPWAAECDLLTELDRQIEELAKIKERHRVCDDATRNVRDLIGLAADGDKVVVYTVFILACQLVAELDSIVEVRPTLGRLLARDMFFWPTFISRKRSVRQANEKLLKTLQLGKGGIFSESEWQLKALSTRGVFGLFRIGSLRAGAELGPRLTRENKKKWFDETWDWLLGNGFKPERTLGKLGGSKARKKPKYCKRLHPATQLANLRSEIKSRVWQAFDKIFHPGK